jgi:Xaa-Pro aminopeptidase
LATYSPVGSLSSSLAGALELTDEFDPVLLIAQDRPSPSQDSLPALADPAADFGGPELKRRREDVELKHERIREFLNATNHDAVVLGLADSVAWFTSGGDLGLDLGSESSSILLYVNRSSRAVIADNVQSGRVFEEELAGLGFQLKEHPWHEDAARVVAELGHNKRLITDLGSYGVEFSRRENDPLRKLRRRLTPLERLRLRMLGRTMSQAVEATCRNFDRGEREADIAGHLAHRLIREGVTPVDVRIANEDRQSRFRQPRSKAAPILHRATISVTGRRHGLCASLSRTVSFGEVDETIRAQHALAAMVDATCIFFSRPGQVVSEVFRRAKRIYEKFNHPQEWLSDYQGNVVGYSPREAVLRPESALVLESDFALAWSPSVRAARAQDTIMIDGRGYEIVTPATDWPQIEVSVKGYPIQRPGILIR